MTHRILPALLAATLTISACAGRPPQQIAVVQPMDAAKDCAALTAEIAGNSTREADLSKEEDGKRGQNVAAGVVGAVLFWPALFLMDFQDGAGKDRHALESRDQYLAALSAQRCTQQPLVASGAPMVLAPAAAR
ncbi:MAG TPA: hypothetical protein VGF65_11200 [Mycobacterium sp.]